MKQLLTAVALCVLVFTGHAATLVGTESSLPLTNSALWSGPLNFQPGDGAVVEINPPSIQWSYTPLARDAHSDMEVKSFVLQASYDSGFAALCLNVTNDWNFYSVGAPFTNSPVYWRAGYRHTNNSSVYQWSDTRSFTIAPSAKTWDRSALSNPDYLTNKVHPFIMTDTTNFLARSNFLHSAAAAYYTSSSDAVLYDVGNGFRQITNYARQAINLSIWPTNVPSDPWSYGGVSSWMDCVGDVAMMWASTRDPVWSNAQPGVALSAMAVYYVTNDGFRKDIIADSKYDTMERTLALGYDWLYELMDSTQRSNVLRALELRCKFITHGFDVVLYDSAGTGWTYDQGDPTGYYTNNANFLTRPYSQAKFGHSHGTDMFNNSMIMALAGARDSAICRFYFNFGANYMLGPTYLYANIMGVGRPYTLVHLFENKALNTHCMFQASLPEVGWTNNPFWERAGDWFDRSLGVQFSQGHEPWGDTTYGTQSYWQDNRMGRQLALFTGNGRFYKHWKTERSFWISQNHSAVADSYWTALMPYYLSYTNLAEATTTNLAALYAKEGWVISSSAGPSDAAGFTNGAGMIFRASPAGSINGHGTPSLGSFQFWAYGSCITDSGAGDIYGGYGYYEKVPWNHYTLTVNGLGMAQPQFRAIEPYYTRLTAYTNNSTFTYAAADLTRAFARSNNYQVLGGDTVPTLFNSLHDYGPLWFVSDVKRHMLFQRKKYWVIYDTLATVNLATNTFSQLYHVLEPTLSLDTANMRFTYTATNAWPDTVGSYNRTTAAQSTVINSALASGSGDNILTTVRGTIFSSNNWADLVVATNGVSISDSKGNTYQVSANTFRYYTNGSGSPYANEFTLASVATNATPLAIGDTITFNHAWWLTNATFAVKKQGGVRVHVAHIVDPSSMTVTNLTGTNVRQNPFTGEDYWHGNVGATNYGDLHPKGASLWFNNKNPATNWHFMTVIYPVRWNEAAPTITRIDDYTVAVTNGADGDIISFDTNSSVATLIVDVGATNAPPTPQTAQPTFSPAGPTVSALPTNVTISAESGAATFYSTNGSTYYSYSTPVSVNSGVTLYAYATNAAKLDSYVTSTTFSTNNPSIPTVGTVTISPNGGTFTNSISVTLICATNSAAIYYTTTGTTPSASSTPYTAPFTLSSSATVKAVGILAGHNDSAVASATFTKYSAPPPAESSEYAPSAIIIRNVILR